MNKFVILTTFLIFLQTAHSQDISKYLDDGRKSSIRQILSIGYDPFSVTIPITYERKVVESFSYVIAVQAFDIRKQLWFDSEPSIDLTGVGFSASIRGKAYFGAFPEKSYLSIYPQITKMHDKYFVDFVANTGYQRVILQKVVLDINLGIGLRLYSDNCYCGTEDDEETIFVFYFPVTINLGYPF